MKLGDRGYMVHHGKDGPWLCEYEVAHITPSGASVHWKPRGNRAAIIKHYRGSLVNYYPAATPDEAISHFQENQLDDIGALFGGRANDDRRARILAIIRAEAMRG